MKFSKGDRVELRKELEHLSQGLKGKIVQTAGNEVRIQFDGIYEIIQLDELIANEYLRIIS